MADNPPVTREEYLRTLQASLQEGIRSLTLAHAARAKEVLGDEYSMFLAGASMGVYLLGSFECSTAYLEKRRAEGNPMGKGEEVELVIEDDHCRFAGMQAVAALLISDDTRCKRPPRWTHPIVGAHHMLTTPISDIPGWMAERIANAERYEEELAKMRAMENVETQGNA